MLCHCYLAQLKHAKSHGNPVQSSEAPPHRLLRIVAMIQTGLIQSAHDDLVTDLSYDYYGLHLATCSLDQR